MGMIFAVPLTAFLAAATAPFRVVSRPFRVLVLSAGDGLARSLERELGGPAAVTTVSLRTLEAARVAAGARHLNAVVVDATAPSRFEVENLVELLRSVHGTALVVLWGSDVPVGWSMARALEQAGIRCVLLWRREGLAPLCDLLLSRSDGSHETSRRPIDRLASSAVQK
jgi:hypothetical protein